MSSEVESSAQATGCARDLREPSDSVRALPAATAKQACCSSKEQEAVLLCWLPRCVC